LSSEPAGLTEHHIEVGRTARYAVLGRPGPHVRSLWIVLHGYGQLAAPFLACFEGIAAAHRLIAAPEALSRFYDSPATTESHRTAAVGASWMTREDRLAEIADYLAYFDRLDAELSAGADPERLHRTVLGFSQGAAAAARWAAHRTAPVSRLVLWGGVLPDDVAPERLRPCIGELVLVAGARDPLVTAAAADTQVRHAVAAGIPARHLSFPGGHRLDRETLATLSEPPSAVG
jgi:predicted esterase